MANVTLREVYKYYDKNDIPAVVDFNLDIVDKEFVVFVGPSGCGKSTTLRMIAGLEEISYGEIRIDDKIVNDIEPKNRNIAMVFQNYALYPHMSVYDNIAFGLKIARVLDLKRNKDGEVVLYDTNRRKYKVDPSDKPVVNFVFDEERQLSGSVTLGGKEIPLELYKSRGYRQMELKEITPAIADPTYYVKAKNTRHQGEIFSKDDLILEKNGEIALFDYNKKRVVFPPESTPNFSYSFTEDGNIEGKVDVDGKIYSIALLALPVGFFSGVASFFKRIFSKRADMMASEATFYLKGIVRKHTKAEIKEKVYEAADILDIRDYLDRKPKAMSGGQRQRVAIGRAIVRQPKVFLMDEPLSNLDAKLRNQMRAELILLRKRINTTFIYVTHDQTEAMTLGDKIVIMKDGFVQQVGSPKEVFENPENLFVAGFIGSPQMNMFEGKIVKGDKEYFANILGKEIPLGKRINNALLEKNQEETDIILGIRPEHITLLPKSDKTTTNFVESQVSVSEMMGSELYVHTIVGEDKKVIIRVPTLELAEADRESIENNGKIRFTFSQNALHLFDKETQKNLVSADNK